MGRLAVVLGTAVLAVATARLHTQLRTQRSAFPADADVLYLPAPAHLERMSLGYREAVADLVWCRAVVFVGDEAGGKNTAWIAKYLDAILHLAPRFRRPYDWAGVTFVYTGDQVITREMVDRAIAVYRRGLARFPEDHELLFALGMLLYRDVQSVAGYSELERKQAKAEGAEQLRRAAAFGAPPLVRQLAATLVDQFASDQLAIRFLETQLAHTSDPRYRRLLRNKLARLAGARLSAGVERLRGQFLAEREAEFPYVAETLYAVIRSAPMGSGPTTPLGPPTVGP
ncbi:MAG: hypothetical protein B7733_22240 [Myxococcales bacterium FL481]|nr:MAG: hypothetical protein B7733_22240 [Myxococcales bacterium FL481]